MPTSAGTLIVQVNVPLELLHAELLAVRFVATGAAPAVGATPFTVVNVIMTDCTELETYCGARVRACALVPGTEIVNRAVVWVIGPAWVIVGPALEPEPVAGGNALPHPLQAPNARTKIPLTILEPARPITRRGPFLCRNVGPFP